MQPWRAPASSGARVPRNTAASSRRPFPALRAINLVLGPLARVVDAALVGVVVALVLVTGTGVASRYIEGSPFAWTDEVASHLFVALTFLGTASGTWRGN